MLFTRLLPPAGTVASQMAHGSHTSPISNPLHSGIQPQTVVSIFQHPGFAKNTDAFSGQGLTTLNIPQLHTYKPGFEPPIGAPLIPSQQVDEIQFPFHYGGEPISVRHSTPLTVGAGSMEKAPSYPYLQDGSSVHSAPDATEASSAEKIQSKENGKRKGIFRWFRSSSKKKDESVTKPNENTDSSAYSSGTTLFTQPAPNLGSYASVKEEQKLLETQQAPKTGNFFSRRYQEFKKELAEVTNPKLPPHLQPAHQSETALLNPGSSGVNFSHKGNASFISPSSSQASTPSTGPISSIVKPGTPQNPSPSIATYNTTPYSSNSNLKVMNLRDNDYYAW